MTDIPSRKKLRKRQVLLGVLLVAANLILFNILSDRYCGRWDLTENKMYTLSPVTARTLENMDDVVLVKYYITKDLPPGYQQVREKTEDMLNEFKVASNDKVNLVFLDPSEDENSRIEAEQLGIPELSLPQYGSESYEVKLAYMGLSIHYEDRTEAIPVANPDTLEYELLMRIVRIFERIPSSIAFNQFELGPKNLPTDLKNKLESKKKKKNRQDINGNLKTVKAELEKQYFVETVDLRSQVPESIETLVISNPDSLDETAMFYVDQFLMGGGKLLFLLQGVRISYANLKGGPRNDLIDTWLEHYGITGDKNIVLDTQCAMTEFAVDSGGYRSRSQKAYFPYIRLTEDSINRTHTITRGIRELALSFVSSINLNPPDGASGEILLRSSPTSWAIDEKLSFYPEELTPPDDGSRKSYNIAGLLEGEFISYYAGRSAPEEVRKRFSPTSITNVQYRSPVTSILVIGGGDLLRSSILTKPVLQFFGNAVDYLTVAKDYGEIRARETKVRRISPEYADNMKAKNLMKIAGTLSSAGLVILVGLILYLMRKTDSKNEVKI